jgi:feruloyl esterase
VGDAIFSAEDTRQWMLRLDKGLDGKAADFAKYYPVPGMAHCSAGPATDRFDMLDPLVDWVEKGVAPQAVVASARGPGARGAANPDVPRDWTPTRSRPLCPAPLVARYKGSGSLEEAGSFECR